MLIICVVRQKQALMDVMSRKSVLDALAGYHPFWLSAALEVISFSFPLVMVLVLFPQLHAGLGYHPPPTEAAALHEYTHDTDHKRKQPHSLGHIQRRHGSILWAVAYTSYATW